MNWVDGADQLTKYLTHNSSGIIRESSNVWMADGFLVNFDKFPGIENMIQILRNMGKAVIIKTNTLDGVKVSGMFEITKKEKQKRKRRKNRKEEKK